LSTRKSVYQNWQLLPIGKAVLQTRLQLCLEYRFNLAQLSRCKSTYTLGPFQVRRCQPLPKVLLSLVQVLPHGEAVPESIGLGMVIGRDRVKFELWSR
jgi:hypothetical protein